MAQADEELQFIIAALSTENMLKQKKWGKKPI